MSEDTRIRLDVGVAEELVDLLGFLADLCDHEHDRIDAALDRFAAYSYPVGELRADAVRLARRLERVM